MISVTRLHEVARMVELVPKDFGHLLPSPCNDFMFSPIEGSHTTAWCQVFYERAEHPGFDYDIWICHIYAEHDAFPHSSVVVSDDEVHYCCLCPCKPGYELVGGDDRKLMVVHKDMKHGDNAPIS